MSARSITINAAPAANALLLYLAILILFTAACCYYKGVCYRESFITQSPHTIPRSDSD